MLHRAFQLALENCKMLQSLSDLYKPSDLNWIVVRQFSWHSVGIILSTVLRDDALGTMARTGSFMQYVDQIMSSRTSVDYFAGNETLWELIKCLQNRIGEGQVSVA